MPELAEVDYYRKQWDAGLGQVVTAIHLHPEKRIFRGTNISDLKRVVGEKLQSSEAAGKQMLFRFSRDCWLGIHLGMTGRLALGPAKYQPAKHDHLVLYQKNRALVFNDMRQFGRVLFHKDQEIPSWWSAIGPGVTSPRFTLALMKSFLARHSRLAVKSVLLIQKGFPGIGNWMADEILWRAAIVPAKLCQKLTEAEVKALWTQVRFVARQALTKIGKDFGDPPRGWLFHERWKRKGLCPKHRRELKRETIGGRTTAWCPLCQK